MVNKSEANLVSFKVILNRNNEIITEFSILPENMVNEIFPKDERDVIKSILRNGKTKLGDLHSFFQREVLDAIADPHPYVLNLTSSMICLLPYSLHLICSFITSPHAGAPTIPVPTSKSVGSNLPTEYLSGFFKTPSNLSTTFCEYAIYKLGCNRFISVSVLILCPAIW
jgi:hypothetical protein